MDVQLQIAESDKKKVLMWVAGEGQGAAVFKDFDAFISFTEDCLEYIFELVPIEKMSPEEFVNFTNS
jgi:hypothetical protein